jgi:hypothetical protein
MEYTIFILSVCFIVSATASMISGIISGYGTSKKVFPVISCLLMSLLVLIILGWYLLS